MPTPFLFVYLNAHTLALQSMTAQWLGSPAVSVCSSIWYYLALIELSSIPSLSPPSVLLLSSFPLLPARDGWRGRWSVPNPLLFFLPCLLCVLRHKHKLLVSWPVAVFFILSVFFYLPITSAHSRFSPHFFFLIHLPASSFCCSVSSCFPLTLSSISIYEQVLMGL